VPKCSEFWNGDIEGTATATKVIILLQDSNPTEFRVCEARSNGQSAYSSSYHDNVRDRDSLGNMIGSTRMKKSNYVIVEDSRSTKMKCMAVLQEESIVYSQLIDSGDAMRPMFLSSSKVH